VVGNILLMVEEVLVNMLLPIKQVGETITLALEYAEKRDEFQIVFDYSGKERNPLLDESEDNLSVMIVKNKAKNIQYSFSNNMNQIVISI
jgi:hypothetical protein